MNQNPFPFHIPEAMKLALNRAMMLLRNLPSCSYKIQFNGAMYEHDPSGVFNPPPRKRTRIAKTPGLPHGGLTMYIKGYTDNLEPGAYVEVPFVDPDTKIRFDTKSLASTCAAVMARTYGAHNYTTHKNDEKECVEIFLGANI
jgi:hypothetical protein